ncbi:MAG TPA: hypothetical protein VK832_21215 [Burkholderiaceae bacterium]|nr:hypothetical protein [Burkholderiaceae bacterium]
MKNEREDLVETYHDMSTEELLDHWESGTLTELAMQVASEELAQRGVALPSVKLIDAEGNNDGPLEEIVFETIAKSYAPTEMHILRGRLEADGIPAVVVDDDVNQTNSILAATGGVHLQVPCQYAIEAKRIVAEVKSGELAYEPSALDGSVPEPVLQEKPAEKPTPNWELLVIAGIFIFASFSFIQTMWFAYNFNANIEWDIVAALALVLPTLYFVGALLLAFRSKWAILCFAIHLPLSVAPTFLLTPDEPLQVAQIIGWICTAGIIYFCVHMRRQGRIG